MNSQDELGETALHIAARLDLLALLTTILIGRNDFKECVDILVNNGASLQLEGNGLAIQCLPYAIQESAAHHTLRRRLLEDEP